MDGWMDLLKSPLITMSLRMIIHDGTGPDLSRSSFDF